MGPRIARAHVTPGQNVPMTLTMSTHRLLSDHRLRPFVAALERGDVPLDLVDTLVLEDRAHPDAGTVLDLLLDLPSRFTDHVLTIGCRLPDHPLAPIVRGRVLDAIRRTRDPVRRGYFLAGLARLDKRDVAAAQIENVADQVGGRANFTLLCPGCGSELRLSSRGASNDPLVQAARAVGATRWAQRLARISCTSCACGADLF